MGKHGCGGGGGGGGGGDGGRGRRPNANGQLATTFGAGSAPWRLSMSGFATWAAGLLIAGALLPLLSSAASSSAPSAPNKNTAQSVASQTSPNPDHGFYIGAGIGYYDADYSDAFLNDGAVTLFLGYDLNAYFAVELAAVQFFEDSFTNDRSARTTFKGAVFSPSVISKYPLDEHFNVFLRLGAGYIDYTTERDRLLPQTTDATTQFTFGLGVATKYLTAEYVNYGEVDELGLELEQLRLTAKYRF